MQGLIEPNRLNRKQPPFNDPHVRQMVVDCRRLINVLANKGWFWNWLLKLDDPFTAIAAVYHFEKDAAGKEVGDIHRFRKGVLRASLNRVVPAISGR